MATETLNVILSRKKQKARPSTRIYIPVQYMEKSLLHHLDVPHDVTVATVKETAASTMIKCLKDRYHVTLERYRITVHPVPQSEAQKWVELGKEAMVTFWPVENDLTPLNKRYAKLEEIEDKSSDWKSTINAMRQEFNTKLVDSNTRLNMRIEEQSQELCRLKSFLNPLLFRVLMDDLRRLVTVGLKKQNWHDIEQDNRQEIVENELKKLREKSKFAGDFCSSALDMAVFLANDHSKIRNDGNTAAHSGAREDISDAVLTLGQGKEWNIFIDAYRLLYNREPTL